MQILNVDFTGVESSDITKSFLAACLISFLTFISLNYVLIYGFNIYAEHPSKVYLFDHKHYLNIATIVVIFFIMPLAYFITSKAQDTKPYRFWLCCSVPMTVWLTALLILPIYTLLVPITTHDRNMDYLEQLGYVFSTNKLFIVLMILSVLHFVIEITRLRDPKKKQSESAFGGAKEATIDDLRRKELLVPKKSEKITSDNKYICYGELNGRLIGSEKPLNTCVFSPPGGGKGVTSVKPKLLDCPYPIVCNDVKFENAMECSEYREKIYGMKAYIIDPFNVSLDYDAAKWGPKQTLHIDLNIGKNVDMNIYVSTLANAIAPKDSSGKNTSHYEDAQIVLEGILYYIVSKGYKFPELFDLVVSEKGLLGLRKQLLEYNKEVMSPTIMLAAAKIKQLHSEGEMTKYGADVIGILTNGIRLFGEQALKNIFSEGDKDKTLDINEYLAGKADIYIVVPPNMVEQTAPFIKLILGLIKSALEFANPTQLKARYYPMLLDEVAQLGYLKIIEQMYEVLRYKGVVLWLYFQDMSQLKVFAKAPMFKSFKVLQFFEISGDENIKFIRELAGFKTIEVQSKGDSKSKKGSSNGSTSTNISLAKTELLTTDKIRELDESKQIIFHPACPVILCDRTPYYSHQRYKNLAEPNLTRLELAHLIPENNDQIKSEILDARKSLKTQEETQYLVKDKNTIKKHLLAKLKKEKKEELITFKVDQDNYYITDKMFVVCIEADLNLEIEKADKYLEMLLDEEFLTPESINDEVVYKINK